MAIRVGTCAWSDHHNFYPKHVKPGDRLSWYARYFSLVEIDSSFYRIPTVPTVAGWIRQTPTDFMFDMKAYKTLTRHDRGESTPLEWARDFDQFLAAATVLAESNKLGLLLFQFPPWFLDTPSSRAYVEILVERTNAFQVGIEFRNRSWFTENKTSETMNWLRELRVTNVVCDEPQTGMGTIPFVSEVTDTRCVMFRLHGRNEETWYQKGLTSSQQRFDYLYSKDELASFLPVVQEWVDKASDVHILMNNNQGDYAVTNALDWKAILGHKAPERPVFTQTHQTSLFDWTKLDGRLP